MSSLPDPSLKLTEDRQYIGMATTLNTNATNHSDNTGSDCLHLFLVTENSLASPILPINRSNMKEMLR